MTNYETKNSYTILDSANNRIYFALEGARPVSRPATYVLCARLVRASADDLGDASIFFWGGGSALPGTNQQPSADSDCCSRQCLGPIRPLKLHVTDNIGREVLTMDRPCRFDTVWCPFLLPINYCWLQKMEIFHTGTNELLGRIEQRYALFTPTLAVLDERGTLIMTVIGPCWHYCRCDDIPFDVFNAQGQSIGTIIKKWSGFFQEAFTDADNFRANCACRTDRDGRAGGRVPWPH